MQARISFVVVVAALLALGFVIPYTVARELPLDPVAVESQAAEAVRHDPPLPAAGACLAGKQPGIPDAVLYFWDFEGNNGGFIGTLDWVWGTYAWSGATCNYTPSPPPAAHSGTDMWGTRLNDCYQDLGNNSGFGTCVNGNPADDSILSFTVDLTAVTGPVEMSWWEWFDLFLEWDWGEVYVNGQVVFQHCGGSYTPPTVWVQQTVDLTPFAGGVANVEIHMMASTVVDRAGWFVDDVMVYTLGGGLEGRVTDVETGSVDPTCTRALVHVEPGGLTIPADLDGYYAAALAAGTYTVTATAPGYSAETAVVTVTTDVTTTQDFALRRPVVDVDPLGFDVDLVAGQAVTLPLTVANLGHLELSWSVEEQLPPTLMVDLPWVGADPISGTVPPQNHTDIDVTFTCTQTGDYTGTLLLTANDPCAHHIPVPLALHCKRPVYYIYIPLISKNP